MKEQNIRKKRWKLNKEKNKRERAKKTLKAEYVKRKSESVRVKGVNFVFPFFISF